MMIYRRLQSEASVSSNKEAKNFRKKSEVRIFALVALWLYLYFVVKTFSLF